MFCKGWRFSLKAKVKQKLGSSIVFVGTSNQFLDLPLVQL